MQDNPNLLDFGGMMWFCNFNDELTDFKYVTNPINYSTNPWHKNNEFHHTCPSMGMGKRMNFMANWNSNHIKPHSRLLTIFRSRNFYNILYHGSNAISIVRMNSVIVSKRHGSQCDNDIDNEQTRSHYSLIFIIHQ